MISQIAELWDSFKCMEGKNKREKQNARKKDFYSAKKCFK